MTTERILTGSRALWRREERRSQ